MKIKHTKVLKDGRVHVLIELGPTEAMPEQPAFSDSTYYRLGYPLEEVVPGHIINDAKPVAWCPVEQRWRDA